MVRDTPHIVRSLRIAAVFLIACLSVGIGASTAQATACTGERIVMSATDLNNLATNCTSYDAGLIVTLANNVTVPSGTAISPIGTSAKPFVGTFDGSSHTITGVTVNGSGNDQQGLFGVVGSASADGEVKNLTLVNPTVTGRHEVGAVAGRLAAGTIRNVEVRGATVTGSTYVGGLVGYAVTERAVQLRDVSVNSTTFGTTDVGGAVGVVNLLPPAGVTIDNLLASGLITGTTSVGGVIGALLRANGAGASIALTDVGSRADITSAGFASNHGGVVGLVDTDNGAVSLTLERVYAGAAVPLAANPSGGILGFVTVGANLAVSTFTGTVFWDPVVTGQADAAPASVLASVASSKTTAQLTAQGTYVDWSIAALGDSGGTPSTWTSCTGANGGYPFLRGKYATGACDAPGAPTAIVATPLSTGVRLALTPGAAGDAPTTSYEVSIDDGGWNYAGAAPPLVVWGLPNGVTSSVRVRAVSAAGWGAASAAVTVVPGGPCQGFDGTELDGAGTLVNPYRVASAAQLRVVGQFTCGLDAVYRQTADIAMPTASTSAGVESNFTPIGNGYAEFVGVYDGDGHAITGLVHVDGSGSPRDEVGLFGVLGAGAEVRDLRIVDARMGGSLDVGTLSGLAYASGDEIAVSGVSATGAATGLARVGGLIGRAYAAGSGGSVQVTASRATVTVSANQTALSVADAGGLIGLLDVRDPARAVVSDVRAAGAVTIGSAVLGAGGLIGGVELAAASGTPSTADLAISDAFASGAVTTAGGLVGGLVGRVGVSAPSRAVRFERVAASGRVTAAQQAGGLIGRVYRLGGSSLAPQVGHVAIVDAYVAGALVESDQSLDATFGGIVGETAVGSTGIGGLLELDRLYARGAVPAGGQGILGVQGFSSLQFGSLYWDEQTTGRAASGLGVFSPSTTAQLQSIGTYDSGLLAWPIVAYWATPSASRVWGICAAVNGGYPFLLAEYGEAPCAAPVPAADTPAATTPVSTPTAVPMTVRTPQVLPGGRIAVRIAVTGPGRIALSGVLIGGRSAKPACRADRKVAKAGTYALTCRLDAAARRRLAKAPLRLRLTTSFAPASGTVASETTLVRLPRSR